MKLDVGYNVQIIVNGELNFEGRLNVDTIADLIHTAKERFTLDDLFDMADGCGYGEAPLTAKDEARWQIGRYILETEGYEVEDEDCTEDAIFDYLSGHQAWFDRAGNLLEVK